MDCRDGGARENCHGIISDAHPAFRRRHGAPRLPGPCRARRRGLGDSDGAGRARRDRAGRPLARRPRPATRPGATSPSCGFWPRPSWSRPTCGSNMRNWPRAIRAIARRWRHRRRSAGLRGRRHRGRAEPRRVHQRVPALDRRRARQSRPFPRDRQPARHRAPADPPGSPTSPTSRSTPATSGATRAPRNPDFGATFDQIATIRDQPAIPTSNSVGDQALAGIVRVAAFHFAWVEQGGTSLYDQFVPYISSREVLRIVSSIYATEAVHYAIFRDSLNGITAFQNGDQSRRARSHRRQNRARPTSSPSAARS